MWIGAGSGNPVPCGASFWGGAPFFLASTSAAVPLYVLNRFSERLAWSTPSNPYSLLLQEKRQAGARLLDLTTANPTEAFPGYPHQDIARAYGALSDFRYEPAALGIMAARQIIAAWYGAQGIPAEAHRIALTASTSEAYAVLFKLLCDSGDEILIPYPSYPLFDYLARAEAVKTTPYQLMYDGGWFMDFASVQKALSARTKAIVVVNPNNPTGSFLKHHEARKLALLAEQHELALISDEVFMSYPAAISSGRQVRSLIGHNDVLSFSLNGLSKAAGMPQMKLGWIAVNGPQKDVDSALAKLELLLDSYLSVATPVQAALAELLQIGAGIQLKIDSRLRQNRAALAILNNSAVEPLASEGGWSAILQIPSIRTEEDWITKLLAEEGVVVQPGYFYDMAKEAFIVLSLIASPADFAEGLHKLIRLAGRC
jgi:alanine-synthesizing transaminase